MTTKKPAAEAPAETTLDPVAHVEAMMEAGKDAEAGIIGRLKGIPQVTAESAKLSEMMDNLSDLKDFAALEQAAEKQRIEAATIDPIKEPVKLPPPRPRPSPAAAAPVSPKSADVTDYEPKVRGRRRTAAPPPTPVSLPTGGPSGTSALTGEHVASLLEMTHAIGATVLGPAFSIPHESAVKIGEAAMPVLEDFGVQVASRAVHLLMLVSTVFMIEGPIMAGVWMEMQARAQRERTGMSTMAVQGGKYKEADVSQADLISQYTGVQIGNAPAE